MADDKNTCMRWTYNDGGRTTLGLKHTKSDCVCRSVAIVTGKPYQEVQEDIRNLSTKERVSKLKKGTSDPDRGVYKATIYKLMGQYGFVFVPTMGIGTGCKVHLKDGELPMGNLLVNCSKHLTAVIDGVIHDTHDPSREGRRCVYGYWKKTDVQQVTT